MSQKNRLQLNKLGSGWLLTNHTSAQAWCCVLTEVSIPAVNLTLPLVSFHSFMSIWFVYKFQRKLAIIREDRMDEKTAEYTEQERREGGTRMSKAYRARVSASLHSYRLTVNGESSVWRICHFVFSRWPFASAFSDASSRVSNPAPSSTSCLLFSPLIILMRHVVFLSKSCKLHTESAS